MTVHMCALLHNILTFPPPPKKKLLTILLSYSNTSVYIDRGSKATWMSFVKMMIGYGIKCSRKYLYFLG